MSSEPTNKEIVLMVKNLEKTVMTEMGHLRGTLEDHIKQTDKRMEHHEVSIKENTEDRLKKNAQFSLIKWAISAVGLSTAVSLFLQLGV